ncbi:hypothetical protein J2O08_17945 [Elizabethkingia anophelis]|uniref:hypothetical protein n=1 Tax=Elizabethkingia anophelis TaxID=1117645 RepID=UPI0020B18508|nr:hypothetical protein [Elizabethkingia anophelis]UTF93045.1 hypothetical protein J2O08_17945 [Elizabethkingia anophelis]
MEKHNKKIFLPILIWSLFLLIQGSIFIYIQKTFGNTSLIIFALKEIFLLFSITICTILISIISLFVELNARKRKYYSILQDYSNLLQKYYPELSFEDFYNLANVREELYHKHEHLQSAELFNLLKRISTDIHFSSNIDERKKAEELIHFFQFYKPITPLAKMVVKAMKVLEMLLFKF